jgi:hypothetical protein
MAKSYATCNADASSHLSPVPDERDGCGRENAKPAWALLEKKRKTTLCKVAICSKDPSTSKMGKNLDGQAEVAIGGGTSTLSVPMRQSPPP